MIRPISFTVVTVSFNNATTIRQTIESVLSQTYPELEYWVIDGGSTDGTVEILQSYGDRIRWISEPDKGLYYAMNKGWERAGNEFVGYLNADDYFEHTQVIEKMAAVVRHRPGIWAMYGDLVYVNAEDPQKVVRYWEAGRYWRWDFLFGWMPPHPTFYVRRQAFELLGGFRANQLRSAADYELMLRMLYIQRLPTVYIPGIMVRMRVGGVSNQSFRNRLRGHLEDWKAWTLNRKFAFFFTFILKPLRKLDQFFIRPENK